MNEAILKVHKLQQTKSLLDKRENLMQKQAGSGVLDEK